MLLLLFLKLQLCSHYCGLCLCDLGLQGLYLSLPGLGSCLGSMLPRSIMADKAPLQLSLQSLCTREVLLRSTASGLFRLQSCLCSMKLLLNLTRLPCLPLQSCSCLCMCCFLQAKLLICFWSGLQ